MSTGAFAQIDWLRLEVAGSQMQIDGLGAVIVPEDVFAGEGSMRLRSVQSQDLLDVFREQGVIFGTDAVLEYFIVVEVLDAVPKADRHITLKLELPDAFVAQRDQDQSFRAFAYLFSDSEDYAFESFEPVSKAVAPDQLNVRIPTWFFAQNADNEAVFEVIIAVAIVDAPAFLEPVDAAKPEFIGCPDFGPPLDGWTPDKYRSNFGPRTHPITGAPGFHFGTDYAIPTGTPIRALADGEVAWVGYQSRARAGRTVGWGHWLMVIHEDNSVAVFAHLTCKSDKKPCPDYAKGPIERGEIVAYSGQSGGVTGPHLHLEVIGTLNGTWNTSEKLNPFSCVAECDDLVACGGKLGCDSGVSKGLATPSRPRRCRPACVLDKECESGVCYEDLALCAREDDRSDAMFGVPAVDCGTCWKPVSYYACGAEAERAICANSDNPSTALSCTWWDPSNSRAPAIYGDQPRCSELQ